MDLFYRCAHCGNLVYVVNNGSVTPSCCGEPMKLLKAGESDGAAEKHVPVVSVEGNRGFLVSARKLVDMGAKEDPKKKRLAKVSDD